LQIVKVAANCWTAAHQIAADCSKLQHLYLQRIRFHNIAAAAFAKLRRSSSLQHANNVQLNCKHIEAAAYCSRLQKIAAGQLRTTEYYAKY
jgi:hypothetical protein